MGIARDYTNSRTYMIGDSKFQELHYTVTSDGSGDVAATQIGNICGTLVNFEAVMDETDTPTTAFNMYLYTDNSTLKHDLLGGQGESLTVATDQKKKLASGTDIIEDPYKGNPYFLADSMGASKVFVFKLTVWVG